MLKQTTRVEEYEHGTLVRGELRMEFFNTMTKYLCRKYGGKSVLSLAICEASGATLAVCRREDEPAFREELGISHDNPNWLMSGDTGTSSRTIYAVLARDPHALGDRTPTPPMDTDDFGRCYRLVEIRHPEWRPRLGEVAKAYPEFRYLVSQWDYLCACYRESPTFQNGYVRETVPEIDKALRISELV